MWDLTVSEARAISLQIYSQTTREFEITIVRSDLDKKADCKRVYKEHSQVS